MKKFFALLIAAAMLCCMAVVPAAADGVVTFTAGTVNNVNPGDTVTIPVSIDAPGGYEAHALRLFVRYDTNYLTVNAVNGGPGWTAEGGLPDDAMKTKDFTTNPGTIAIGVICPQQGMTSTGVLVNIVFTVSANCNVDQVITVEVPEFTYSPLGGTVTEIPVNTVNGAINMASQPVEPTNPPQPTPGPVDPTPGPVEPGQMNGAFAVTPRTVAASGDTITISLTVNGSYNAHTMNVAVDYDPDALTLVEVQRGAALNNAPDDAAIIIDSDTYDYSVRLGLIAPTNGFTATGVLLTLTFTVNAEFEQNYADGTPITVAVAEFDYMPEGAATGTAIPCTVAGGIVVPKGGDTPTPTDGPGPNPPVTGAVSFVGLGILAIMTGAGAFLFRKKED